MVERSEFGGPIMSLRLLVLLAFAALTAAAERPVVFVSIPPQAWLVRRLAGDSVEVETLLTPGANPHTFEPGARQVKKLAGASLYLLLVVDRAFARLWSSLAPLARESWVLNSEPSI